MLNLDEIYDNLDKMASLKRVKRPSPSGYFPTVAEINTYAYSKDVEHMIPFLLWLDENLSMEDRKTHKAAITRLKEIVDEMFDEDYEDDEYEETVVSENDDDDDFEDYYGEDDIW